MYIGKSVDPKVRLIKHLYPCELKERTKKANWLKSLVNKNLTPKLIILGIYPIDLINSKEIEHIELHKTINNELKNQSIGGDGNVRYKPIICSNGKTYESAKEASRQLNIDLSGVLNVLKGKKISISGLTFQYIRGLKVIRCSNGNVYKTAKETSAAENIPYAILMAILQGRIKGHNKKIYTFEYQKVVPKTDKKHIKIAASNGKIYSSITEAAADVKLESQKIRDRLFTDPLPYKTSSIYY